MLMLSGKLTQKDIISREKIVVDCLTNFSRCLFHYVNSLRKSTCCADGGFKEIRILYKKYEIVLLQLPKQILW